MGTEDLVLKGKKLITKIKKQQLKIYGRGQTLKNTILKKSKITQNIKTIYIYIYMKFSLKIGSFFCKVIGYKNEN